MIKADRQTLVDFVRHEARIRNGFYELLDYCHRQGIRFVIISNGLDFYIDTILKDIGVENIEVFAAQTRFCPGGLKVKYIGPEGDQLDSDFKDTYTRLFLKSGYRVIYVGDGISDVRPAHLAHHVFARCDLLAHSQKMNLGYTPFLDFTDVTRTLDHLC